MEKEQSQGKGVNEGRGFGPPKKLEVYALRPTPQTQRKNGELFEGAQDAYGKMDPFTVVAFIESDGAGFSDREEVYCTAAMSRCQGQERDFPDTHRLEC